MQGVDLELFRDIPGYKAILKAVLKSQIQVLVEQLSQQTGEESVLLTASIEEGTLSHLGSDTGKVFMDRHDDIKSQFLGFCLKRHQIKQQSGSFLAALTRKRGPNTNKRPRNPSKLPAPSASYGAVNSSKPESQRPVNLAKRPRTNQMNKSAGVDKREQINTPRSRTGDKNQIKTEPVILPEINNTKNDVNQSEEPEKGNQTVKSVNQSSEMVGDQSNEAGEQSMEVGGAVGGGRFTVVTEDGASVYQGHMDQTDLAESREMNGTDLSPFLSEAEGSLDTELIGLSAEESLEMYITGKDIDISNPSPSKQLYRKSSRKSSLGSRKRLKEEDFDSSLYADSDERPYPCTSCPKRFKERHHLTYHLRTHSGQRPYVCEICNKAFTQTSSLNTHRKIHMNEVSCGMCGRTFRRAAEFANHVCYSTEQLDYNNSAVADEEFGESEETVTENGAVG